jgi:hypothetical protein
MTQFLISEAARMTGFTESVVIALVFVVAGRL